MSKKSLNKKISSKIVSIFVAAAFIFNSITPGYALRPGSFDGGGNIAGMALEFIQRLNEQGVKALKAKLADLGLNKTIDPAERALRENNIGVFQKEGRIYIVSLAGAGWIIDLSKPKGEAEHANFSSVAEKDAFISGGQFLWLPGTATPEELVKAQEQAEQYLREAQKDKRIFTADNLEAQVAEYSQQRAAKGNTPLSKQAQGELAERLRNAFGFHNSATKVLSEKKAIQIILDEDSRPSYFYLSEVDSAKFRVLKLLFGEKRPYPLDMIESSIQLSAEFTDNTKLYQLLMGVYLLGDEVSRPFQESPQDLITGVNDYQRRALAMWKEREIAARQNRGGSGDLLAGNQPLFPSRIDFVNAALNPNSADAFRVRQLGGEQAILSAKEGPGPEEVMPDSLVDIAALEREELTFKIFPVTIFPKANIGGWSNERLSELLKPEGNDAAAGENWAGLKSQLVGDLKKFSGVDNLDSPENLLKFAQWVKKQYENANGPITENIFLTLSPVSQGDEASSFREDYKSGRLNISLRADITEEEKYFRLFARTPQHLGNMQQILEAVKSLKEASPNNKKSSEEITAEVVKRAQNTPGDVRGVFQRVMHGQSLYFLNNLLSHLAQAYTGKGFEGFFAWIRKDTETLPLSLTGYNLRRAFGMFSDHFLSRDIIYTDVILPYLRGEDLPVFSHPLSDSEEGHLKRLTLEKHEGETLVDIPAVILAKAGLLKQPEAASIKYASWGDFEAEELTGKEINQQQRNLSEPLKIAFNIDSFAVDNNVVLFGGINRIFDSIFRLLEGNPNFTPVAIFLGDYAPGIPSDAERLAEFLNVNPALGSSKYKVKLGGDNLIINGQPIKIYSGLATGKQLDESKVDFLIEATQQKYLNIRDKELRDKAKTSEEEKQAERINNYLKSRDNLKVVVIAPEEDKDEVLAKTPLAYRVNTAAEIKPDTRKFVLAEPVTVIAQIMQEVINKAIKEQYPELKTRVSIDEIVVARTDRQGDRAIDALDQRPALALDRTKSGFRSSVSDTGPIAGANAIKVILRIEGYIPELAYNTINTAFRKAGNESLKGLIDFKGEPTASSFEIFNPKALVFNSVKEDDLKTVRPSDGPSFRTVALTGFYSETGYAKPMLDLITAFSVFTGNKATAQEQKSLQVPKGAISATPEKIRKQVVPDGEAIPVVSTATRGRIMVNTFRRAWDDPNYNIVAINGLRNEDITSELLENDQVFGPAPFTVEPSADRRSLKIADREERTIIVVPEIISRIKSQRNLKIDSIRTPYGNLVVEQDAQNIKALKLHGENVLYSISDNKDGTFIVNGKLKNGTTVKLTYAKKNNRQPAQPLSIGLKKQIIIPFANIRADKSAYTRIKGEDDAAFLMRVDEENRKVARKIIAEFPWLNENTILLETSGQLIEAAKLEPFYLAGAGSGLISAPAKGKIPGRPVTDITVVPGVNNEAFLSTWDLLKTASAASCTTNAAAVGIKALLNVVFVVSGYFDTIHALTNTQGRQFGEILKNIARSVDARGNIVYESTGASSELGKAIAELLNTISGVSIRVGNDDGSLVNYTLHVMPRKGKTIPNAEEINKRIKELSEIPEIEDGLKGFLGYHAHKSSLEIIGSEFPGIFDPSKTFVNQERGIVSTTIWYDNERGYTNNYIMLALLKGLHKREQDKEIEIIAQDVVAKPGASTGRISVESAKENGATGAVVGLGRFRIFEEEANKYREKPKNINEGINESLKKSLELGVFLPVLNVYISEADIRRGVTRDTVNRQVSEAFKDIPPEDMMRIMISLEVDSTDGDDFINYLEMVKKAAAGYVTRFFVDNLRQEKKEILRKSGEDGYKTYLDGLKAVVKGSTEEETINNYANLLGANTATKMRLALKLKAGQVGSIEEIQHRVLVSGVDGIIAPADNGTEAMIKGINDTLRNHPEKLEELGKRISPRFFIGVNSGSMGLDYEKLRDIYSGVNPHYIQVAAMPNPAQISIISSLQKGEKAPEGKLPLAAKVPVRALFQNVTLREDLEGFVNLDWAAEHLGLQDVMVDHSEVIELMGITDVEAAAIVRRIHELREAGKISGTAVVAVGEVKTDYDAGRSKEIVRGQVINRLSGLTSKQAGETIVAYEPRWAIGTGLRPTSQEIQDMHGGTIRNTAKDEFGVEASQKMRVIYGGSADLNKDMDPAGIKTNAEVILRLKDVDGLLVGGASTKVRIFEEMVAIAEKLADNKNAGRPFYRKFYIGGNHKAYEIDASYTDFVRTQNNTDRSKTDVSLGPELSRYNQFTSVYVKDPLKDIVVINQLKPSEVSGRTFFVRVDFNMTLLDIIAKPGDPDTWQLAGDARIRAALDTINYIRDNGGVVVIVTHFDPKGDNVRGPQSVQYLAPILEKYLKAPVTFVADILGPGRQSVLKNAKPGDVILFENVRLNEKIRAMEKSKDPIVQSNFNSQLYAGPASGNPKANVVVVKDGFGVMHREQASVVGEVPGVPQLAGVCLARELEFGVNKIRNAKHLIALVLSGGSKLQDKIPMLRNIILNTLTSGDAIFVYGAAAFPFLMAMDPSFEPGESRKMVSEDTLQVTREIIALAEEQGIRIITPKDLVVAHNLPRDENEKVELEVVESNKIPPSKAAYDIGPKTIAQFEQEIFDEKGDLRYHTILENGPAGVFEHKDFRDGTQGIHNVIARAARAGALAIFGGGDTGYAVELTLKDLLDEALSNVFVSTGGGAFLELLEGKELPGVESLRGKAGIYDYHRYPYIEEGFARIRSELSAYAAENADLAAHARPKDEYSEIVKYIRVNGRPLSEDAQDELAALLFKLPSMWNAAYLNGRLVLIFSRTISALYDMLGLGRDKDFMEEEKRHEVIEWDLQKAAEEGRLTMPPAEDIIKEISVKLGGQYAQFKEDFAGQYGLEFEKNIGYSVRHLVAEKLDGGFWLGGLYERVYQAVKEMIPYIGGLETRSSEILLAEEEPPVVSTGESRNVAGILSGLPELAGLSKEVTYVKGRTTPTEFYTSMDSQGTALEHKVSDIAFESAKDTNNQKVILMAVSALKSDPSLILAAQSSNRQINRRFNILDSDENKEAVNAYRFILIGDDPEVQTQEDIDKLFAEIAPATSNGVKPRREIYGEIITQEDMSPDEGKISDPAALLKHLDRVGGGVSRESVVALVGPQEWIYGFRRQEGISKDALGFIAQARKDGEIAFAGKGLYAAIELVATKDKSHIQAMMDKFGLRQIEAAVFEVVPQEISPGIADKIKFYRDRISQI